MLFSNYFIENAEIRSAAEIIHIPNCRDSDGAERIPTPNRGLLQIAAAIMMAAEGIDNSN